VVANSPGTIDADYQDEVFVCLANFGKEAFRVTRGMKIAQLVILKGEFVSINFNDNIAETKERTGGFGSTGE
jgi:dUTP pyrophosphatase